MFTAVVWDPTRGEELLRFDVPDAEVTQCQWSTDGRCLAASGADGTILIWDASAGYDFLNSQEYVWEQMRAQQKEVTELLGTDREADALPLLVRTLETLKTTLGPEHEETALIMHKLAHVYQHVGRLPEAVALFEQSLAKQKVVPGPDATSTLRYMTCLAEAYQEAGRWNTGRLDEAIVACRAAIRLRPHSAEAHNNLARFLATCPDPKVRDPVWAVELARKAIELAPQQSENWNTLGVAHYRGGDWKATVAALEKSMELANGGNSFDWLFLAMAHWKLGHNDEARAWYDKAAAWKAKNLPQPENGELRRFRAEAEALMGPADIFARP
jgi:tetratricopeptide (TPR) repeat protein